MIPPLSSVGSHQSRVAVRCINDPDRQHVGVAAIGAFEWAADFEARPVRDGPGARHQYACEIACLRSASASLGQSPREIRRT